MDMMEKLKEFHEKFGLAYNGPPHQLSAEVGFNRIDFMNEELTEYIRAWQDQDLEKMLDALGDLVYVVLGTAYLHGFNFNEAFKRIHETNLKKIRVVGAGEAHKFDIVKPEGWEPPFLSDLVRNPNDIE
jgi:predicted HAD superfamily Cof-like phosphohydrolase